MLNADIPLDSPRARAMFAGLSRSQARRVRTILTEAQKEAERRIARAERRTEDARASLATAQHKARLAERRLEKARAAAEELFSHAMEEALAVLTALPDFDALEAKKTQPTPAEPGRKAGLPRSALSIVREVCDAGGFSMAVIKGRHMSPAARAVQAQAIGAVARAFPDLGHAEIGALFGGMSKDRVRGILEREGGE
jgi:hypothetical protein